MNISELQFSVASVSALIKNFHIEFIKSSFQPVFPIFRIKTDEYDRCLEEYIKQPKKSKRGRKKTNVDKPKNFKSNVSFFIKLFLHRPPTSDDHSAVAVKCGQHENCEIFAKTYNVRIFNGGIVVCVGILRQDKSDFNQCVEIVKNYLVQVKLDSFNFIGEPLRSFLKSKLVADFEVTNVVSTLENYQFNMGLNINLYFLKAYFIKCSQKKIININYSGIYDFLTDCIDGEKYSFNADILMKGVEQKNKVCLDLVNRNRLHEELIALDLKKIHLEFEQYWQVFKNRNSRMLTESFVNKLKYNFLKQYIRHIFKDIKIRCAEHDDDVVNSVIFEGSKNTLMVIKPIMGRDINFRIFDTGVVNIQGGNSYEISYEAKKIMCRVLSNSAFLYDPENPPMVSWRDCLSLKPVSINEKSDEYVNNSDDDSSDY